VPQVLAGRQARDVWARPGTDLQAVSIGPQPGDHRDGLSRGRPRNHRPWQIFDGRRYKGQWWNNSTAPAGCSPTAHGLFFVGELGSGMPVHEEDHETWDRRKTSSTPRAQRVASRGQSFESEKRGVHRIPTAGVVDSLGESTGGEVSRTGLGSSSPPAADDALLPEGSSAPTSSRRESDKEARGRRGRPSRPLPVLDRASRSIVITCPSREQRARAEQRPARSGCTVT